MLYDDKVYLNEKIMTEATANFFRLLQKKAYFHL